MNVINSSPKIDFKLLKEINSFQFNKLKEQLFYVEKHSPYYQKLFTQHKIKISTIENWEDFHRIPFTSKDDFSKNNEDFLCVDRTKIADYTTTSGTTGSPIPFYLTSNDLDRLATNEAYSMICAGAKSSDIFQLMTTIDKRFMAGLAYFMGVQKMGAGIVRNGPGALPLQWDSIQRFRPTILIAVPGFIPSLIQYAKENNIDFQSSSVQKIICIGQPIRNEELELNDLGTVIQKEWDVELHSTYASTEMGAAFTECEIGLGGHLPSELMILEVIDENGKHVENGETGEVVISTLGVEAMPLIRYKTGDVCRFYNNPCECGRNTPRLGPVIGRKNQLLKVKGTTIFPTTIYSVLEKLIPENSYYVEVLKGDFLSDIIHITIDEKYISQTHDMQEKLQGNLRFLPVIQFQPYEKMKTIIFSEDNRKPTKFIDKRG
jgi:phenylacetate-CoA ligase